MQYKKPTKNESPNNNYKLIDKSQHLLICCLNTIGNKQEISTTKVITYLLNLPNLITDHGFTYNLGIICQCGRMNKKKNQNVQK